MYTFEDKLKEYAELLVRVGVNVQKGQDLVITAQPTRRGPGPWPWTGAMTPSAA